jgi:predicted Fe-Mo cluster-binding NifX family protein
MPKHRVAIPTQHKGGMTDVVSDVLGRAQTFTIIDIDENVIQYVEVLTNPAVTYKHGAGPVVAKMLTDKGVNTVIATEFGPGVSVLLEHFKVDQIKTPRDIQVAAVIKRFIASACSVTRA